MDWKKLAVTKHDTIIDTMKSIEKGEHGIVIVVDEKKVLLGTVTDGDIRRGFIKGKTLDDTIEGVMNTNPMTMSQGDDEADLLVRARAADIRYVPVIDDDGVMLGIFVCDSNRAKDFANPVIVMAGGLGRRLGDLTKNTPKPMLKVGERPIMETLILDMKQQGFKNFYLSVNYLSDVIENHFGDGSKFGVKIQYIKEDKRLGTAGALGLVRDMLDNNLTTIVVNGDLLTKVNFANLLKYHEESSFAATMCVKEYDFQIPYGVVKLDEGRIVRFDEKPVQTFYVNAGAYAFDAKTFSEIPEDQYFDMNDFFTELISKGTETTVYPVSEYWIDVGQTEDLKRAQSEFKKEFE